jgi:hypothetical protein
MCLGSARVARNQCHSSMVASNFSGALSQGVQPVDVVDDP